MAFQIKYVLAELYIFLLFYLFFNLCGWINNISETRSKVCPHLNYLISWLIDVLLNLEGNFGNVTLVIRYTWKSSVSTKSLQMVTAAMKLKDAFSLEEKLWQT